MEVKKIKIARKRGRQLFHHPKQSIYKNEQGRAVMKELSGSTSKCIFTKEKSREGLAFI